jgi:hypothetical protein
MYKLAAIVHFTLPLFTVVLSAEPEEPGHYHHLPDTRFNLTINLQRGFSFQDWAMSNVESFPAFQQTLQLPSSGPGFDTSYVTLAVGSVLEVKL